jgi:hypothetical protein
MAGNPPLPIMDELDPHVMPHPCVHAREPVGPEPPVWTRYSLVQKDYQFIVTLYDNRTLRVQGSRGVDSPRHGWWKAILETGTNIPQLIEMHWNYEGKLPLSEHIYTNLERLNITARTGMLTCVK